MDMRRLPDIEPHGAIKWLFVAALVLYIVGCCCGCTPVRARRNVKQANYERYKAKEHITGARIDLEKQGISLSSLVSAEERLDRCGVLLDEFDATFPADDFTPTDDSYDRVLKEMQDLKNQLAMLKKAWEAAKGVIKTGTGFSFPLGGSGEREGALILLLGAIAGYVREFLKRKTEEKKKETAEVHFEVLSGEVAQQQARKPGSMDELLKDVKGKLDVLNIYKDFEAALDQANTKTTRNARNDTGVS